MSLPCSIPTFPALLPCFLSLLISLSLWSVIPSAKAKVCQSYNKNRRTYNTWEDQIRKGWNLKRKSSHLDTYFTSFSYSVVLHIFCTMLYLQCSPLNENETMLIDGLAPSVTLIFIPLALFICLILLNGLHCSVLKWIQALYSFLSLWL